MMGQPLLLDIGAQAERTALAWHRTGLTAVAVGVLLAHAYPSVLWAGLLIVAAGVLVSAVLTPMRYVRVLRSVRAGRSPAAPAAIRAAAAAAGILAALTLLLL